MQQLQSLNDECKAVLEATGHYHYPVLDFLNQNGIPVIVANPLLMKKFNDVTIRKGKSDKLDSLKIAKFGLQFWLNLKASQDEDCIYADLSLLSRQYLHYTRMLTTSKLSLLTILDQSMPGIDEVFRLNAEASGKDKLRDFVEGFWHFDNITKMTEKKVGYAGIDSPPYESGKFESVHRKISKRGNKHLRRTGYLIMKSLKSHRPSADPVYEFMLKKELEGKAKHVAMIAGFNKFLRIYYARVKEALTLLSRFRVRFP